MFTLHSEPVSHYLDLLVCLLQCLLGEKGGDCTVQSVAIHIMYVGYELPTCEIIHKYYLHLVCVCYVIPVLWFLYLFLSVPNRFI